jgi:hypothetical protein
VTWLEEPSRGSDLLVLSAVGCSAAAGRPTACWKGPRCGQNSSRCWHPRFRPVPLAPVVRPALSRSDSGRRWRLARHGARARPPGSGDGHVYTHIIGMGPSAGRDVGRSSSCTGLFQSGYHGIRPTHERRRHRLHQVYGSATRLRPPGATAGSGSTRAGSGTAQWWELGPAPLAQGVTGRRSRGTGRAATAASSPENAVDPIRGHHAPAGTGPTGGGRTEQTDSTAEST